MWIKKFRMFKEQAEQVDPNVPMQAEQTNQEALKYLKDEIADYQAKKTVMEGLFKSKNEDTEGKIDLEKELATKVYQNKKFPTDRNRFLVKYEELLNIQSKLVQLEQGIEKDITNITDRESKLNDIRSRKNDVGSTSEPSTTDREQINSELDNQERILTDELKKLRNNINKSKASLNKMKTKDIKDAQSDFEDFVDSEKKRIQSSIT